ncbi:hypothetical protein HPB48_021157 [Haemaphysalis longicornis]|uniref:Cullin family profile domain-containing protein n=1 Tax=Haemaphysalis longicornis TaxID=44386 RepID=A0A9J6FUU1_HAELO|nr:hypothetical protein HPB48_000050 [Haemaphysalis longicornis]KAH9367013.1 hypothetical protein HPB48_021157 [Haemaphysalis longicornis]
MFKDTVLSRSLNQRFRQHMADSGVSLKLDFYVLVLTTNACFYQESSELSLPGELEPCAEHFLTFYYGKHSNRKLTWFYNMSTGELSVYCFKSVYIFQASTFQMVVLLEYNTTTRCRLQSANFKGPPESR